MIIIGTSALLAYFNASESAHEAVRALIDAQAEPLVVSSFVVAELDYLISTRIGVAADLAALDELSSGAYDLAGVDGPGLAACRAVVARYPDQAIGVADASIVILAQRRSTRKVLTLDHRHFGVLRPLQGGRFTLVP